MHWKNIKNINMHKKVLYIWFKRYTGILEGGGIINQRNFNMLCDIFGKENVDSFYVHDENEKKTLWTFLRTATLFFFGYHNGLTPTMVKNILLKADSYDYVFLSTSLFGKVAKKLREGGSKACIITHFHNVESIYYDAVLPKFILGRSIIINCAKRNDYYSCKYSDEVITLNKRDAKLLKVLHGKDVKHIIPIALKDKGNVQYSDVTTARKPLCLFIGSNFPANAEGVLWFVKNVLPFVDINFKIVGKGMSKLKEKNECLNNIDVESDVPDLRQYFMEADFMILPIFSGSGMKVKTCEAMMYGKNIIGTDETFEGYDVDFRKIGGKCNTAVEFIDCINYYISNPVPRFNKYSRCVFKENFSEKAIFNAFRAIF